MCYVFPFFNLFIVGVAARAKCKPPKTSSSNGVLCASAVSAGLHLDHRYRTEQHHNVITVLTNNLSRIMICHYGITLPEQLKEKYEPSSGEIVILNVF